MILCSLIEFFNACNSKYNTEKTQKLEITEITQKYRETENREIIYSNPNQP